MTFLASSVAAGGSCRMADWIELKALSEKDKNASFQDLIADLRRGGSTDALPEQEEMDEIDCHGELSEELATNAFGEIEERSVAAGVGYPFEVNEQYIQLRSNIYTSTYLFQLLLSHYGVNAEQSLSIHPEREFENISIDAAQGYFGRNEHDGSYLFAFPRRTNETSFPEAVDELSSKLGEGGGAKLVLPAKDQKDAHLDLVVWHGFADHRPGQLIAFGQCATGQNWKSKLTELPAGDIWCRAWMQAPPAVSPIRMFFVPHRLTREEWSTYSTLGGIPFDRCRIAYHTPKIPSSAASKCAEWIEAVLKMKVQS